MNLSITLFEIPATDITRAIRFYEALWEIRIDAFDIGGMRMGILPNDGRSAPGVIIQMDGSVPSADGVTLYLTAGDDLQAVLDRVEPNGGRILLPKTAHADDSGYFALFLDSEGNRMALNSPN